jgi:hypothetical protein
MKLILPILLFVALATQSTGQPSANRYYELRIYYCNPGKLETLLERFTNHTTRLFEKHGMENVGYWVPINNEKNTLYYILAFPDRASRDASFKSFIEDPVWKEVAAKSEEKGKIIQSITSIFMKGADLLPAINAGTASPDRTFELRTYTCAPGRVPNLTSRFKNHTLELFKKHGMENIAYFLTEEKEGEQSKLVYLLAHKSETDAATSWAGFRADAHWIKVKEESEKDGTIVEKVESIMMKPASFSKIK